MKKTVRKNAAKKEAKVVKVTKATKKAEPKAKKPATKKEKPVVKAVQVESEAVKTPKNPETGNVGKKIWEAIKNANIEIYGMKVPVSQQCSPVFLMSEKLHLSYKSPAFWPALETALGEDFTVEADGNLLAVSIKPEKDKRKNKTYIVVKTV